MADPPPTRWHRLLGALLDAVLSPVGVSVETDIAVTAEPPRADMLLLRREQPHWNEAQRQRLADGLRDTAASHLLIEFKYTEGLTESAFAQLLSYDYFYRRHRRLAKHFRNALWAVGLSSFNKITCIASRSGWSFPP